MEQISTFEKIYLLRSGATTDNGIFRLYYIFSVRLLFLLGLLASSTQYFSNKIECTPIENVNSFIKEFCWVHNYYPWVPIALFVQAMFLYLPRFIWSKFETQIVDHLLLNNKIDRFDESKQDQMRDYIIDLLIRSRRICRNSKYYVHIFTEFLNLFSAALQILFMNKFFNMNFLHFGFKLWNYSDPMAKAFPNLTKCNLHAYGYPDVNFTCILPINLLNQKVYFVVWLWYQLLIICSIFNMINRIFLTCSTKLRCAVIMEQVEIANRDSLISVVSDSSIGEWYILNVLSLNINSTMFNQIINELHRQRRNRE